ncbi:hypothetical protein PLESTM_001225000 [Pleodorina starrii]|nr:hypothetical protein PLESTM_001225000 [Pleodorina starrii]
MHSIPDAVAGSYLLPAAPRPQPARRNRYNTATTRRLKRSPLNCSRSSTLTHDRLLSPQRTCGCGDRRTAPSSTLAPAPMAAAAVAVTATPGSPTTVPAGCNHLPGQQTRCRLSYQ